MAASAVSDLLPRLPFARPDNKSSTIETVTYFDVAARLAETTRYIILETIILLVMGTSYANNNIFSYL